MRLKKWHFGPKHSKGLSKTVFHLYRRNIRGNCFFSRLFLFFFLNFCQTLNLKLSEGWQVAEKFLKVHRRCITLVQKRFSRKLFFFRRIQFSIFFGIFDSNFDSGYCVQENCFKKILEKKLLKLIVVFDQKLCCFPSIGLGPVIEDDILRVRRFSFPKNIFFKVKCSVFFGVRIISVIRKKTFARFLKAAFEESKANFEETIPPTVFLIFLDFQQIFCGVLAKTSGRFVKTAFQVLRGHLAGNCFFLIIVFVFLNIFALWGGKFWNRG